MHLSPLQVVVAMIMPVRCFISHTMFSCSYVLMLYDTSRTFHILQHSIGYCGKTALLMAQKETLHLHGIIHNGKYLQFYWDILPFFPHNTSVHCIGARVK